MPKRKRDVIDLTESLTDLPDNLLAEILKLLPLREQARMGLVSKNLNHLSSVEFFNVIQHPAVNQLASRMKSRLRRPYLENAMFLPHLDREKLAWRREAPLLQYKRNVEAFQGNPDYRWQDDAEFTRMRDQMGRRLRNVRVAQRNRYDDVPTGKFFTEQNNANKGGLYNSSVL